MNKEEIIKALRDMARYPTVTLPRDSEALKVADDLLAQSEHPAQQEPVEHCRVRPLRGDESFPKVEIDWVNHPVPGPLFTTPPQRKPLTDEEIKEIANNSYSPYQSAVISFARAIEAAHGIKE